MSTDLQALESLLQIETPWALLDYRIQPATRRCDVWIGLRPMRAWFGARRSPPLDPERRWRHLNAMGLQVWVHAALPVGADFSGISWAGDDDMPFSHAMTTQIFALMEEGATLEGICRLFDIQLQDVWKYKYALDRGRAGRTGVSAPTTPSPRPIPTQILAAAAAEHDGPIPDVSHPVWAQLAEGQRSLDIHLLSLKLLLNRVRGQFAIIEDDDVRMLKVRELHRFFVRNARLLNHELEQLREAA